MISTPKTIKIVRNENKIKLIKKIFPKSKNIKLKQFRIYDPFTNAISISNLIKQVMHHFVFNDLFKITFFLLHLFADIRQKNRILIDRKSTRLNSSHKPISYAVFCLKKKTNLPHIILHSY